MEKSEAVVQRCSVKRCSLKFHKIHRKTLVPGSLFYQIAGLRQFVKFVNTLFTEHLWWLLLKNQHLAFYQFRYQYHKIFIFRDANPLTPGVHSTKRSSILKQTCTCLSIFDLLVDTWY